jgi:hypothetical protein
MALRDLGPQALVSRNICYQQHQFLIRSLEDMSSDGRKDRHNSDSTLPKNNIRGTSKVINKGFNK